MNLSFFVWDFLGRYEASSLRVLFFFVILKSGEQDDTLLSAFQTELWEKTEINCFRIKKDSHRIPSISGGSNSEALRFYI